MFSYRTEVLQLTARGDRILNKDQVKGMTKDVAGKVQEQAGKLVGSKEQQIKGLVKTDFGERGKRASATSSSLLTISTKADSRRYNAWPAIPESQIFLWSLN